MSPKSAGGRSDGQSRRLQIAYTLAVPRKPLEDENGPAWVESHIADGANRTRPFITGKVNIRDIQWQLEDGKRILYCLRERMISRQVSTRFRSMVENLKRYSSTARALARTPFILMGKTIAFLAEEERPEDGQDLRDKGFNQQIYEEDSPRTFVWSARRRPASSPAQLSLEGSASYVEVKPATATTCSSFLLLLPRSMTATCPSEFM